VPLGRDVQEDDAQQPRRVLRAELKGRRSPSAVIAAAEIPPRHRSVNVHASAQRASYQASSALGSGGVRRTRLAGLPLESWRTKR
jgi:hypothetical protein